MKKLFILPLVLLFACDSSEPEEVLEPEIIAEAQLYSLNQIGDREYEIMDKGIGKATFFQAGEVVVLEISLSGMTPNTSKAVHIHEGTVQQPGRHWNAGKFVAACENRSLGKVWAKPFIGDVGNVNIDGNGNGTFSIKTDLWKLNSGDERDLLDRPIIIHENSQDFIEECNPFHDHTHDHFNPKIGGGKITLVSDIAQNVQSFVQTEQMPDFLICK
ncbi:MAG: superoxide dismutase family protein [Bacteroidota bacterium]